MTNLTLPRAFSYTLDPRSLLLLRRQLQKGTMDPVLKEIEPVQYATDKIARTIDEDEIFQRDWSDDEERRAKRKLV